MSELALRVEGLSKAYKIANRGTARRTFREDLAHLPGRMHRSLRGQSEEQETYWALKDVSFDVRQGDIVGIVGRNGAGKSTLLKILSRITEPSAGYAEVYGRVASLLEVGTGFHGELTGRENIFLSGAVLGLRRAEIFRQFDAIVEFAGVESFLDTPVKHFSSGMYMRLAFSVAAHLDAEVLFIDEVLAVGDAEFQKKCLNKMDQVSRSGRTVLFVSHNMASVLALCNVGIFLRQGQLITHGTTQEAIQAYLQETVIQDGVVHVEARGTKPFAFTAVEVHNHRDQPSSIVEAIHGCSIVLTYVVSGAVSGVNVSIELVNEDGLSVLTTSDVDTDPALMARVRPPGRYVTRCEISPAFLRPGRYTLNVSCSLPRVQTLDEHFHILGFEAIDTGTVESQIGQGRRGVIAPVIPWTVETVADSSASGVTASRAQQ